MAARMPRLLPALLLGWHAGALVVSGPDERATLGLDQVLQRMQYWRRATSELPSTGKYLLFTPDAGGLNNIRIGWELTGVVARRTGRTLVLPPASPMYLLDFGPRNDALVGDASNWTGLTRVEDLIDLAQLKGVLPTLTAEEFEREAGLTWRHAVARSEVRRSSSADKSVCRFQDWERVTSTFLYMDGQKEREGFMCGEWFLRGGPRAELRREMAHADWALLRHGFVWHRDAFEVAAKVVRYLGLFEYIAAHARYGDFAEHQSQRSADDIYENWRTVIDNATALYVATDRQDRFAGLAERRHVRLLMWPDLFSDTTGGLLVEARRRFSPERWYKLTGLIEELICTYSKVFIGTDRSSFTGHIERMRLHADSPVRMHLVHTDGDPFKRRGQDRDVRVPFDAIQEQIHEWGHRRWKVAPITSGDEFLEMGPGGDAVRLDSQRVPAA